MIFMTHSAVNTTIKIFSICSWKTTKTYAQIWKKIKVTQQNWSLQVTEVSSKTAEGPINTFLNMFFYFILIVQQVISYSKLTVICEVSNNPYEILIITNVPIFADYSPSLFNGRHDIALYSQNKIQWKNRISNVQISQAPLLHVVRLQNNRNAASIIYLPNVQSDGRKSPIFWVQTIL